MDELYWGRDQSEPRVNTPTVNIYVSSIENEAKQCQGGIHDVNNPLKEELGGGGLRGLTGSALDHLSSNLGVGITEGCFIFDFASLP